MPPPQKRKRGAIETARHQARLNKKRQDKIHAPLREDCAPTWQDKIAAWVKNNMSPAAAKAVAALATYDRHTMREADIPRNTMKSLREAGVIAVSEGFVILSKKNKLKRLKLI